MAKTKTAAQIAFAKKAAALKAKAKSTGLPASLIAANHKHLIKEAWAETPDAHSEHDQQRVHAPRAPPIRLLKKNEVLALVGVT